MANQDNKRDNNQRQQQGSNNQQQQSGSNNQKQRGGGGQNSRQQSQQSGNNSSGRGFASMDADKQREIASKGGKAAHESGNAHEFTSEEAREAGSQSHKNDR
ncbi:MAG TPA: hypothetical protein DCM30_06130 [Acinetobacter radioresistens]|nr:hypothetical protein [Acinetobacter radioresistens]